MDFEHLQEWGLYHLSGRPVQVFGSSHSEKVFPDVQREHLDVQFVPAAFGSVTEHYWKEPVSVLFAPSLLMFI